MSIFRGWDSLTAGYQDEEQPVNGASSPERRPGALVSSTRESMPPNAGQRRFFTSTELFAGAREILIDHSGETYTLRRTSLGKLILTK